MSGEPKIIIKVDQVLLNKSMNELEDFVKDRIDPDSENYDYNFAKKYMDMHFDVGVKTPIKMTGTVVHRTENLDKIRNNLSTIGSIRSVLISKSPDSIDFIETLS